MRYRISRTSDRCRRTSFVRCSRRSRTGGSCAPSKRAATSGTRSSTTSSRSPSSPGAHGIGPSATSSGSSPSATSAARAFSGSWRWASHARSTRRARRFRPRPTRECERAGPGCPGAPARCDRRRARPGGSRAQPDARVGVGANVAVGHRGGHPSAALFVSRVRDVHRVQGGGQRPGVRSQRDSPRVRERGRKRTGGRRGDGGEDRRPACRPGRRSLVLAGRRLGPAARGRGRGPRGRSCDGQGSLCARRCAACRCGARGRSRRRRSEREGSRVGPGFVRARANDRRCRLDGGTRGPEPGRNACGLPLRPGGADRRRLDRAGLVSPRAAGRDHEPRVQRRRPAHRHRRARQAGLRLERLQRQAHPRARRSLGASPRRRHRARRHGGRHREHRRHGSNLGRRFRRAASTPLRAHELRPRGRLQPRRAVGGHGQPGRHGADLGAQRAAAGAARRARGPGRLRAVLARRVHRRHGWSGRQRAPLGRRDPAGSCQGRPGRPRASESRDDKR